MNGIRNTVSAIGDIGREVVTQVALQKSADTVTDTLRAFADLEEKYGDFNRQRLSLRALKYDLQREVQRCKEKATTHAYNLWITEASDVDKEVAVLLTKYEEMQASNRFWLRPSLSSEMEQKIAAIEQLVKKKSSMVFQVDKPPEPVLKVLNAPPLAGYPTLQGALEKVLELVKNSKIKAIGVHGLKGVGKTAIMQNLNNHEEDAKLFDIIIFVRDSDDDETHIELQQKIARRLKVDTKRINDPEDLGRKIHEEL